MTELATPRLTLRHWLCTDRDPFAALNADPEVMRFFPSTLTRDQSDAMVDRMADHFDEHGWGLWAVDHDGDFIGFTGLAIPGFDAPFQPAVEIGWRFARHAWGQGFATEAAHAALGFAFGELALDEVVSFAAVGNARSRAVMERLGMTHDPADDFDHPRLVGHPFQRHVLYRIGSTVES